MKIAVGLSGGVDSSVAAVLLQEAGHHVVGITMKHMPPDTPVLTDKPCCFGGDTKANYAHIAQLCNQLGIEHHLIDLSEAYEKAVLTYFKETYKQGKTPNPCIQCNRYLKFGLLVDTFAQHVDFDYFATGHYARIRESASGFQLLRAVYEQKDQSYFLSQLTQDQLARSLFPLGNLTKQQVREIALQHNLISATRTESQDFYAGDYTDLFEDKGTPGDIVDTSGKVLGTHTGYIQYTIGQRRGLGIGAAHPLYVVRIDVEKNHVIVGTKDELYKKTLLVHAINWINFTPPDTAFEATARIRLGHKDTPVTVQKQDENLWKLTFQTPISGVAPGQAAVLYKNEQVLGGGEIIG